MDLSFFQTTGEFEMSAGESIIISSFTHLYHFVLQKSDGLIWIWHLDFLKFTQWPFLLNFVKELRYLFAL